MAGKIPGSAHANLALGGLVIVGGGIGFLRKGSKPSLLAGLSIGGLLLGSGYLIARTDQVFEGHCLAAGASGVMALAMGSRVLLMGAKFMPAGMVAVLGAAGCAYNVNKALEWAPVKGGACKWVFFLSDFVTNSAFDLVFLSNRKFFSLQNSRARQQTYHSTYVLGEASPFTK